MKVYVVCSADDIDPVWKVYNSLIKADEEVYNHYVNHSDWLKVFEHDVL